MEALSSTMDELSAQNSWLDISPAGWTAPLAAELTGCIDDHAWIAVAATATRAEDVEAQLILLAAGIASSWRRIDDLERGADGTDVEELIKEAKDTRFQLWELHDKARTWQELRRSQRSPAAQTETTSPADNDEDVEASWQFDGDDDDDDDKDNHNAAEASTEEAASLSSLPDFLDTPILQLAFNAAAEADFVLLRGLFKRHASDLSSYRLAILDRIPLFAEVEDYLDLLPQVDTTSDTERINLGDPWPATRDTGVSQPGPSPRTAQQISDWYKKRVEAIDSSSGRVDNCLALIQHGASQGVPGLDAIGEELSLLSKLVYASHGSEEWTWARWRTSSPAEIVDAYLIGSTPDSIVSDIKRMALPYLFVVESQKERAGTPDATLHERLLHEWLLKASSAKLQVVASVFESSKPNLRPAQRIIRDDLQLVRLALAVAYGYRGTSHWETLAAIFDCLPALEDASTPDPNEQTLIRLVSGSSFNAADLYTELASWSTSGLSQALDEFDAHLEGAEIFARWHAARPLSFFVTLSADSKQQRMWADRLARTAASGSVGGVGADFEYEDEWISLLDDLCKLSAGGKADAVNGPVLGSLSQNEMTRIFFSGLLSSGKFDLAKSLFNPSSGERPLDPAAEQELVLAASREFYDNAETANLHSGNMKLAFDCLAVAPATPDIRRERDFIEATSRLASFRLLGPSGLPLTPLEVRLTSDRMSLISQLLRSNDDAYRHPDLFLELVGKLGYRGDLLAETRALSLLADAALAAGDAARAAEVCDRMVSSVAQIRKGRDKEKAAQAADMAWKTCFSFGKEEILSTTDPGQKLDLLGQALLLCPPGEIGQVLSVWQVADSAQSKSKKRVSKSGAAYTSYASSLPSLRIPSASATAGRPLTPTSIHLPQSAEHAARAALSVGRAATAYLPFRSSTPDSARPSSRGGRDISQLFGGGDNAQRGRQSSDPRDAGDVRDRLQKGFTSGIGWLIGADEEHQ